MLLVLFTIVSILVPINCLKPWSIGLPAPSGNSLKRTADNYIYPVISSNLIKKAEDVAFKILNKELEDKFTRQEKNYAFLQT